MELLRDLALKENMLKELHELEEWNNKHYLRPLDNLNDEWMKENAIIESDDLYALCIQVSNELGGKCTYLLLKVISEYGVSYVALALAMYYMEIGEIELSIKAFHKCLKDEETKTFGEIYLNAIDRILDNNN